MSWQATAWASQIEDGRLSVGERFLLFSLCNYADEEWSCYPGVETLARLTGQSSRTVIRQASRLEEFGYVRRERRSRADGKRTSDRWFIQQPKQATVHPPEQPPVVDQVTDRQVTEQPPLDQVTDCHVTNEASPSDSCVTYIEEGIPAGNPSNELRSGAELPAPHLALVDSGPPGTAQTLVGEWIEHRQRTTGARPTGRVIGQLSKEIKALLDEGQPYADVRAGLQLWDTKGLHPSTLASCVDEARAPRRPTNRRQAETDRVFATAMARAAAGAPNPFMTDDERARAR